MGARCCRSDIWVRRRRFRVNHTDCGRAAETQLHADTNDHVGRGGNRGRQPGDVPSVRQGKQRQRPAADGVGLPLRWLRVPRLRVPGLPLRWLRLPLRRLRRLRLRLRRRRLPLLRLLATCRPSRRAQVETWIGYTSAIASTGAGFAGARVRAPSRIWIRTSAHGMAASCRNTSENKKITALALAHRDGSALDAGAGPVDRLPALLDRCRMRLSQLI
jgi:hypothetical protein